MVQGARYKDPKTDHRVTLGGAKAEALAAELEKLGWEKLYPVEPVVKPVTVTVEKAKVVKFPAEQPQEPQIEVSNPAEVSKSKASKKKAVKDE